MVSTPQKNMKVSWDDSSQYMESDKIPWFQSPPTRKCPWQKHCKKTKNIELPMNTPFIYPHVLKPPTAFARFPTPPLPLPKCCPLFQSHAQGVDLIWNKHTKRWKSGDWYRIHSLFIHWPSQEPIDWRYLPFFSGLRKAYVRGYTPKIWPEIWY